MSSTTLQKLTNADAASAVADAVEAVAERSFYAVVDRCPQAVLTALAAKVPRWLIGTVRFEDGPLTGAMSCTVPEELAQQLFDSFSGRDPQEPMPTERELHDLVGEFANMVCGAWLSRCATERAFRLGPPMVARVGEPAAKVPGRMWIGVGLRPTAIDVSLLGEPHATVASVGA